MKEKIAPTLSLVFMGLLLGFPQISETIYTPSLPDLAHGLNVSEEWAEFTLSIYFIGFALGVFLWGVISDGLGRRPAMLWGIALYTLGSWGCTQADHITTLLAWRLIQGCGASAGSVVTQTMIRDLYTGVRRNQIFSMIGGILALSPALGPLIGGWMDELAGWRGNFAFLVGMGGLLLAYTWMKLPETQPLIHHKRTTTFGQVAKQFILDPQVLGYGFLIGASNGILFSYYAEAPFLFINLLHFTPVEYGLSGMVIAASSILASFVSHRLNSKQYQHHAMILMGCYVMGLAALGLIVMAYEGAFLQATTLHVTVILGLIGVLFFGIGLVVPNALSQALNAYQKSSGTAGALFGLFYYILIATFTFLMGFLHNGTALPMPLYFLTLVILMAVALYSLILPRQVESKLLQKAAIESH